MDIENIGRVYQNSAHLFDVALGTVKYMLHNRIWCICRAGLVRCCELTSCVSLSLVVDHMHDCTNGIYAVYPPYLCVCEVYET